MDILALFKAAWGQAINEAGQSTDAELARALDDFAMAMLQGTQARARQAVERALTLQATGVVLTEFDGRFLIAWPEPMAIADQAISEVF